MLNFTTLIHYLLTHGWVLRALAIHTHHITPKGEGGPAKHYHTVFPLLKQYTGKRMAHGIWGYLPIGKAILSIKSITFNTNYRSCLVTS